MKLGKIFLLTFISLLFTCESSNDDSVEITVSVSDFETSINENPSANESIGFINATTNQGNLVYSIIEQNPSNSISMNSSTGEITVANPNLFDFETNPQITGTVKVINGDISDIAFITINLIDLEEITVTATDLEIDLSQIPIENEIIGQVIAETNEGNLTFEILNQSPNEILQINTTTGELHLVYFNNSVFTGNPFITASVRVSNGNVYQDISVVVNLIPLCDSNEDPQLLAFYPMNSNASDESGFNNNGNVNGPLLTNDRLGNSNSAYHFDGNDDEIRIPDSNQLRLTNEFTLMAWVYPEEIKTHQIIRKGTAVNGIYSWPYGLSLSGTNEIIFSITTDGTLTQARKQGYNINEWYLITGVFKNQKLYLYVNDELSAIEDVDGNFNYDDSPLLIGTRLNLPSDTFKGIIDDVRIYDRALCLDDIVEIYSN
ncbi:LamG-like jellyroll fold domain-containing protein [Psychroserpens sp. XS_ASV72]|uniref:LamG-like jellyroll fold domain-containing protein n=1 Tax=Psychroserpens sp. XS_ASV72 TaxID=3241293 RepID=UPI003519AC55